MSRCLFLKGEGVMKRSLILLVVTLLFTANSLAQTRAKGSNSRTGAKAGINTNRRDYGDTYAIFNNRGEMIGLYNRAICSSIGCSRTINEMGTITKVESSNGEIYGFRIKYIRVPNKT